jgi:phospholipase/lecithinase/hemolysin
MKKYACLLFLCFSMNVFAGTFSEMFFFGDSLSDNGNLYQAVKIIPKSPPYYEGRFSNGPVWAEYLGNKFYEKYHTEYQIYAVGGATAVYHSPAKGAFPYVLKEEVNKYLNERTPKEDSLFVIWIGGNDYLDEKREEVNELVNDVVDGTIANIKKLIDHGARHFLILDLPNLSAVPYAKTVNDARKERLLSLTQLHHMKISEAILNLQSEYSALSFVYMDVYHLFNDLIAHPDVYNAKYHLHLTNTADNCWTGGYVYKNTFPEESLKAAEALGGTICADPDAYLFWDTIHPTVVIHQMLAQMVEEKLLS